MPPTHRLIHVGASYRDLHLFHSERLREDRRCPVTTAPAERRFLFNGISLRSERQHIAEWFPFGIGIKTDHHDMFAVLIDRRLHKRNQTSDKELCFIHDNGGCLGERGPSQNTHEPRDSHSVCRNSRLIVIYDRIPLIPRIDIGCQDENFLPEASIASDNALDLTGLTGEHGANYNTEGHRTLGDYVGRYIVKF